jgi:hypothetical protein
MLKKKKIISHIFLDFFKNIFEKTTFWDVPIHLDHFYKSYIFFWVFSDPEQFFFIFLVALTKKKSARRQKFSATKSVQIG